MGYRENIIDHLSKLMAKNYLDGRLYINAAESYKRLFTKNLFRKLAHQKRTFYKKIKYEIQVLEYEILLLGGKKRKIDENFKLIEPPILPVFRTEHEGLIKECYRREKQTLGMHNNLLSKISIGKIREMLLFQKHSIQMILHDIESLGFKIYEEKDNGKNQEKRNLK